MCVVHTIEVDTIEVVCLVPLYIECVTETLNGMRNIVMNGNLQFQSNFNYQLDSGLFWIIEDVLSAGYYLPHWPSLHVIVS